MTGGILGISVGVPPEIEGVAGVPGPEPSADLGAALSVAGLSFSLSFFPSSFFFLAPAVLSPFLLAFSFFLFGRLEITVLVLK